MSIAPATRINKNLVVVDLTDAQVINGVLMLDRDHTILLARSLTTALRAPEKLKVEPQGDAA